MTVSLTVISFSTSTTSGVAPQAATTTLTIASKEIIANHFFDQDISSSLGLSDEIPSNAELTARYHCQGSDRITSFFPWPARA
jgi:hypothetical protein